MKSREWFIGLYTIDVEFNMSLHSLLDYLDSLHSDIRRKIRHFVECASYLDIGNIDGNSIHSSCHRSRIAILVNDVWKRPSVDSHDLPSLRSFEVQAIPTNDVGKK
jgi:hypothetical protein